MQVEAPSTQMSDRSQIKVGAATQSRFDCRSVAYSVWILKENFDEVMGALAADYEGQI